MPHAGDTKLFIHDHKLMIEGNLLQMTVALHMTVITHTCSCTCSYYGDAWYNKGLNADDLDYLCAHWLG